MLNIHQIARRVNRLRQEGARYVRFTDMKKGWLKASGNGYIAGASYSTHTIGSDGRPKVNEDPSKYVTVIEFVDSELHVHVSCSCADFTYRWEWALWNRGAGQIEFSNGDSPETTNPTYKPSMCKHAYAMYLKIKDKLPQPKPATPNKKKEAEKKTPNTKKGK
jgi:hypothetical protein